MPEPGDFFVAPVLSRKLVHRFRGRVISIVTRSPYVHSAIYIGELNGVGLVVEAAPQGVVISSLRDFEGVVWSTGLFQLSEGQRATIVKGAMERVGSPYSYGKVFVAGLSQRGARRATGASRERLEAPRWARRAVSGASYDCSSLVVDCYRPAGVDFLPAALSYSVTPGDLHTLLAGIMVSLVPAVA